MAEGPTTVAAIRQAIAAGAATASSLCEAALDRIAQRDGALHAFLHVAADRARAKATALDALAPAERGPLHGVPVAIKDNLCTSGVPTTAGSKILDGYVPPYDATVVQRLEQAGCVIVGKANCDEFAMGSSTENSAFGPSRNPWDPARTPGGSSGGSAVAVAAGMVPVAIGSDTGGSIRQPAALCGVVGLKPTYGRVSRYGLIAFASSLDQVGPFGRTVADAAEMLQVLAGADPRDATASASAVDPYVGALTGDLRSLRIGVPRSLLASGVDAEVVQGLDDALAVLVARGATVIDVELPHARFAIPVYYLVATAEASSNLARFDGVRYGHRTRDARTLKSMYLRTRDEGFGAEVKRRIMLGTYVLSAGYYDAFYLKAQQVRTLIRRDYERAFGGCDVVALPTTPTPAFRLGEKVDDPLQMYLEDIFTVSANLSGLPAISVPCGFSSSGLPLGLQLMGRPFDESTLLRAADGYERDTDWHTRSAECGVPSGE
jgi:aspartyl-tRNA(Asn)/glutamyl-tRNA(Gln) amidotransferase subunit A